MATTVHKSLLALSIQGASADPGPIFEALAGDRDHQVRLQCVAQPSTALARIAGGGVDLVLLDLSVSRERGMEDLLLLLREVPHVPVVVVCGTDNEELALRAMRAGASGYLMKEQLGAGLGAILHSTVGLASGARPPTEHKIPDPRPNGGIIALLGTKGGVGTTTLALNLASSLARRSTVILVEMHPTPGSLAPCLRPRGLTRNLSHMLHSESATNGTAAGTMEAEECLWVCRIVPGLRILFGPQIGDECAEIEPRQAGIVIRSLARLADYVVVDLPASLSAANRAVMELSSAMALVIERDPVCARLAERMVRVIEKWNAVPQPVGVIVVNRESVGCPMPMTEFDTLGFEVLGVVPPSADSCLSAHYRGAPVFVIHPESLMAGSIDELREKLAPAQLAVPSRRLSSDRLRA
jgi:pilus assembly protein CpaE